MIWFRYHTTAYLPRLCPMSRFNLHESSLTLTPANIDLRHTVSRLRVKKLTAML